MYDREKDLQADIGEDITREALDLMGVSRINRRLSGKIDYKRARYVFHPDYAVKQALLVDSKAEKKTYSVARIQTAQTSLVIKNVATDGSLIEEAGRLQPIDENGFITTTIFVKYHYIDKQHPEPAPEDLPTEKILRQRVGTTLSRITIAALPNGRLQGRYNPTHDDNIWNQSPHSTKRHEKPRTRLSFLKLKKKTNWRVQRIPIQKGSGTWQD